MSKPKIIIFDLDYTLWPFWVDTHVSPPFKKDKNDQIVDGNKKKINFYPEVPQVLENLTKEGYILGIASRTEWPEGAEKLLKLFDWNKYFSHKEIYPGRKTTHFQRIQKESGVSYSEMMFFDDEHRNISDLKAIGVMSILVENGVNKQLIDMALKDFEKRT